MPTANRSPFPPAEAMPKRKERVAPPPSAQGWDFRFANNDAVKGWEQICATSAANARTAWERITTDPRQRDSRQRGREMLLR